MVEVFKNKVIIVYVVITLSIFLFGALKERALMQKISEDNKIISINTK